MSKAETSWHFLTLLPQCINIFGLDHQSCQQGFKEEKRSMAHRINQAGTGQVPFLGFLGTSHFCHNLVHASDGMDKTMIPSQSHTCCCKDELSQKFLISISSRDISTLVSRRSSGLPVTYTRHLTSPLECGRPHS